MLEHDTTITNLIKRTERQIRTIGKQAITSKEQLVYQKENSRTLAETIASIARTHQKPGIPNQNLKSNQPVKTVMQACQFCKHCYQIELRRSMLAVAICIPMYATEA